MSMHLKLFKIFAKVTLLVEQAFLF